MIEAANASANVSASDGGAADEATCSVKENDEIEICIISCGQGYVYTIPSFPALSVQLRQVKYEVENESGDVKLMDDPSLSRLYPAHISIGSSHFLWM